MFWYIFRQNFDSRAVRNGRRKGILDPKRLAGSVVSDIDFAGMSDGDGDVITPAPDRTKSGRLTFRNELTRRFGSKYRDADNTEKLMGELMPLGKAFGIMAVCLFGPGLPTEKALHADRLVIWKNAAKYCLNEDTIQTVLEWPDQKAQVLYMHGLMNTALVCIRTDLPNRARFYGQHHVFCGIRDAETQSHLGLGSTESVMMQ
jgi:hypothetical protein